MQVDQLQHEFERVQADLAGGPILPAVTVDEIRRYLASQYHFQKELPLDEVVQDAEKMLRNWQVQVTHPRYLGLFNPSVTLPSVIAETLVAMYNPQLANWRTSPAGNEIERHTLGWLAAKFGLPGDTIATFTSGGTEANLSAVAVALSHAFPEYGEHGLRTLSAPPSLYLTGEAHHGYNKIAHMTGIGRRALRLVKTDRCLKLDLDSLRRQVRRDREDGWAPFLVVGTAGTTAAGVIDPLPDIARFCREEGLWFHADAAWGGAAILSPALKENLAGIEQADSITCDAHKWLSVPMACGMFFCRHRESVALRVSRRCDLRVRQAIRAGLRSAHQLDPVVAAVHRTQAVPGLGQPGRIRICGDDRAPGAPGPCPAPGADGLWLAGRQRDAAATGLLHA